MRSLKKELDETVLYDFKSPAEKAIMAHEEASVDSLVICLRTILCLLRALHWDLHTSHWLTKGAAFYANHGMFSEMYKATEDDYDKVAEKMMGHYEEHIIALVPAELMRLSYGWLKKIEGIGDLYERALKLETILIQLIANCKELCQDIMTPGIENMLDEIADQHEKHIYLIKQSLK